MIAPLRTRPDAGGLSLVSLRADDGAAADVYLHGAHVTSWRPAPGDEERLFLSGRSEFRNGAAIRGGIPVIFPQFAAEGPLPRHGFARTATWSLDDVGRAADGGHVATLSLRDSPETRAIWDARFLATLTVRVGGATLTNTLAVENVGASALSFTGALHTYLRVHDVARAEVVGLEGARYRDAADRTTLRTENTPMLRVTGALDRVYVGAPTALLVREPERAVRVSTRGFPDVVLWNPGREAAAKLADMEPGGERAMLCVEAAVVQVPVTLAPRARWEGSQTLDAAARP